MERGVPIVQSHCVIGDPWCGTDEQHLVFCSEWSRLRSGLRGIPDSVINPGTPLGIFQSPRRPISANPVVGMVYRLDGDKIDDSAARAIACVLQEVPHARFEVVGDGPVPPDIERDLKAAGFSDRITWHGYVPFTELASIHRSFDVESAPVVAHVLGSGTVHAIASGTPVVGYGIAALPELLRSDAAIATPGSPESTTAHLITAAGAAGLIKVLEAMRAGVRPPTLHVEEPNPAPGLDRDQMRNHRSCRAVRGFS